MSLITDSIISIARLTKDSDNSAKESFQINQALSAVSCQIQPASPEETAIADGVYAQTYICFTTQSGIKVGDKVTTSGTGDNYRVRGIEDWSQIDVEPHFEILLVKMEEEE